MIRLVVYLLFIALVATGLGWLADRPGTLNIQWQGYDVETTVFQATVMLAIATAAAIFLWSVLRTIWHSPAAIGQRILRRRQKRGLDALSSGLIAVGAGDKSLATHYALQARKALPHEPLTQILRAQAAQLSGDRATARRIFDSMLAAPDTEQLGLRGLFLEAEREGEHEAARQFAERAVRANPKLSWSSEALFDLQCKQKDWASALETLSLLKRNGLIEKPAYDRKRAVLLAGQAQNAEENETDKALALALEAHGLAPDLVPAAAVAARILAGRGQTGKAAKIIQKTWARAPHPDLATAYAYARIGDSPRDRLDRVRQLAALNGHSIESPIAIATTAIEARLFGEARDALQPLLDDRLTQRVATLMARIEAGESDDKGRVREWLARAVNAARDPAWTADGVVADRWEPISPVTGALDAFQWRVPVENRDSSSANILGERLEELLAISAPKPVNETPAAKATEAPVQPAAAQSAPVRREDVVDAEAVTVRPEPVKIMPQPAPVKPVETAAEKPVVTQIEAKTISPVQRVSEVSIVKPAAKAEPKAEPATQAATGPRVVEAVADATAAAPAPVSTQAAEPVPAQEKVVAATTKTTPKPVSDAKIFVAPRAPDDPGTDATDEDDSDGDSFPKRIYRAVN
ncbi:MAG: heme biosynthesis HemY N-terminal domain-containing protein [Hyphomicrobiaceae bacterium]